MKLPRLSSSALFAVLAVTSVAGAQMIPGMNRNATGTGNERGLGIGTYDTKTVTHERVVTGTVLGKDGAPLKGARVYLKSEGKQGIKSMTVDDTGKFRFPQLSRTVDYQLWAESGDKRTAPKTISQFDTRDTISRELSLQ